VASATAVVIAALIVNSGHQLPPTPISSTSTDSQLQQFPTEVLSDTIIDSFLDNFDGPTGYDTDLWDCNNCQVGTISSENGTLRLEVSGTDMGLNLTSKSSWPSSKIKYIQGNLMLANDEEPWYETVDLSLHATLASVYWQTGCLITTSTYSSTQAEFSCEIFTVDIQQQRIYEKVNISPIIVNYGDWHTVKIEITPDTFELRFYFDGKLIGTHTPQNADELLKNQHLKAQIGIYTYSRDHSHMIAYFDDVLVSIFP
jgi:hypothetical protein